MPRAASVLNRLGAVMLWLTAAVWVQMALNA
jgi:hypothetical protein